MKTFIGTFGCAQPLGKNFVKVDAETATEARQRMFDAYGQRWAFLYEAEDAAGVDRFNLKEVPFGTPNL